MSKLHLSIVLAGLVAAIGGCAPEEKAIPKETPEQKADLQSQHDAFKSTGQLPSADGPAPAAGGHGAAQ